MYIYNEGYRSGFRKCDNIMFELSNRAFDEHFVIYIIVEKLPHCMPLWCKIGASLIYR